MESKIYFNVDKVTKIELNKEHLTSYEFYPAKSRGRFKFLWLIPLWKKDHLPDRWSLCGSDGYYIDNNDIKSDIKNDTIYRIQDFPKKLFVRPRVKVKIGHNEEIFQRFDSDEDAQEFVDLIVNSSTGTFDYIIID